VKKSYSLFLVMLLVSHVVVGQTNDAQTSAPPTGQHTAQPTAPQQTAQPSNLASTKGFVLEDGTPVKLRLNRNVSSADAHVGEGVDFEVLEEVVVNGVAVVPKASLALGTVTEAQPKRRMARGGKLDMNLDNVRLADGEKAALRAVKEAKGGGHTGAMTAGIVATGLLVWPAAPFFLFMHGKDVTVPKGAEITAYINGDMKLDIAKFQPTVPTLQQSSSASGHDQIVVPVSSRLQIESTPPGADIEVDGSFVGSTPSDVQVSEGDHTITVKRAGFQSWERKLKVSAGSSVHLNADLEKTPNP
jgi:hypothetical protein